MSVLYLVAVQAIYNFAPRLRGIHSCVQFRDALCKRELGAAKYGAQVSHAKQTLILDSLDLCLFRTSKNCFSPTFKVLSILTSSFSN